MGNVVVHNFKECLAFSESASDEAFWDAVYRKAFPNLVNHMVASGDVKSQRMGIDRVIILSNGKTLFIDEKKREQNWDDILLEYISVDRDNTPGWIEKDLSIDYLAYAFMPSKTVYLFPWLDLQRAWRENKEKWIRIAAKKGNLINARNQNYITKSIAVPIDVLQRAINKVQIVKL